jgi:hypothetical protein
MHTISTSADLSGPVDDGGSAERRGPPRTPVLIPAIALCDGGMEYRCVLRDMSETGAKIGIPRRYRLSRTFRLVTGGRPEGFPVRLAWQRGDFAGLILDLEAEEAENL